jgi:hypothetical protein
MDDIHVRLKKNAIQRGLKVMNKSCTHFQLHVCLVGNQNIKRRNLDL